MVDEGVTARGQRKIVTLLTILVALVGLLAVAMVVTGFVVARKLDRADVDQVVEEVTARQARAAARLDDIADASKRAIATLEKRAANKSGVDSGPLDKLSQVITLNQIMVDQLFIMLRHLSETQEAMASAMRPLPAQRAAIADGERQNVSGKQRDGTRAPGVAPPSSPASAEQPTAPEK